MAGDNKEVIKQPIFFIDDVKEDESDLCRRHHGREDESVKEVAPVELEAFKFEGAKGQETKTATMAPQFLSSELRSPLSILT